MARTREELHAAAYNKLREILTENPSDNPLRYTFWVSQEERCVLYDDPNLYKGSTVNGQEETICGMRLKVDETPPHLLKQGYRSGATTR